MDAACAGLRVADTLDAFDRGGGFFDVGPHTYRLAKLVSGGHNAVYAVRAVRRSDGAVGAWVDDLAVRVRINPLDLDDPDDARRAAAYWAEIDRTARMAELGLAPAVYARLRLTPTPAPGGPTRVGVVMQRFEHALDEVQLCPRLIRRMFIESDGEAALVDLYARTSGVMRCIDTKPPNVVVRLSHEPTRREHEGAGQGRGLGGAGVGPARRSACGAGGGGRGGAVSARAQDCGGQPTQGRAWRRARAGCARAQARSGQPAQRRAWRRSRAG
jgi:hypothetical protein